MRTWTCVLFGGRTQPLRTAAPGDPDLAQPAETRGANMRDADEGPTGSRISNRGTDMRRWVVMFAHGSTGARPSTTFDG